jgi:hypothetical protein
VVSSEGEAWPCGPPTPRCARSCTRACRGVVHTRRSPLVSMRPRPPPLEHYSFARPVVVFLWASGRHWLGGFVAWPMPLASLVAGSSPTRQRGGGHKDRRWRGSPVAAWWLGGHSRGGARHRAWAPDVRRQSWASGVRALETCRHLSGGHRQLGVCTTRWYE